VHCEPGSEAADGGDKPRRRSDRERCRRCRQNRSSWWSFVNVLP